MESGASPAAVSLPATYRPRSPHAPAAMSQSPSRPPLNAPADVLRARELVLRYGWNSTAYQLLNPGISLWFSEAGDAVIGYVRRYGVSVVAGAPVCSDERLLAVHEEFERATAATGGRVCYFAAGHRLEETLRRDARRPVVLLGAQPVWDPAHFDEITRSHASLRAQLNRARNKGVSVEEWPVERAHASPGLTEVLHQWLATRGLPPLRFLVEPDTLSRLLDRRVYVALRGANAVAFLVASPIPLRNGWLVEQIVRGDAAPNGTSELLVAHAMADLAAGGAGYATLGLAPLSRRAGLTPPPTPRWLGLALRLVRAHGRRFYNFDGLDAFKAKLLPERWEPIYAISDERSFSPGTLYAIAAAFSGGSPLALVARALARAGAQEVRWAAHRDQGEHSRD